ncbi:unnamed protein product [Schistosoma margrebowiei]|uniref:Uncharacterized protein n=1 Tax=Schistosoma margrebowiei TaxID=48269 RepID=A0A183LLE9_9TREM|nr:unnamed protein product [Schistosoma margrebowiei]
MVVGGSQQGTLDPGFVLLGTRQQGVPTSTSEGKHGIQSKAKMQLDDLDFADNLTLLSHTQQQMQEKTTSVADV